MKALLLSLLVIMGFASHSNAGQKILPYAAFGPQVAASELIGMEWWQWQTVGGSDHRAYPIKVVVYWEQSREATGKKYPVDEGKEQDYRYVEYAQAVKHMENLIKDFKAEKLDALPIEKYLAELKKSYESDQARTDGENSAD